MLYANLTQIHTFVLLSIFLLGAIVSASAQNSFPSPGVSDQQAGWMLVYPYYTSNSANAKEDSFITITNVSSSRTTAVHVLFMDGKKLCPGGYVPLSHTQCFARIKASELDPDNTGYLIAIVVDNIRASLTQQAQC